MINEVKPSAWARLMLVVSIALAGCGGWSVSFHDYERISGSIRFVTAGDSSQPQQTASLKMNIKRQSDGSAVVYVPDEPGAPCRVDIADRTWLECERIEKIQNTQNPEGDPNLFGTVHRVTGSGWSYDATGLRLPVDFWAYYYSPSDSALGDVEIYLHPRGTAAPRTEGESLVGAWSRYGYLDGVWGPVRKVKLSACTTSGYCTDLDVHR